ncbi:MAG: hypothetical protein IT363_04095 [Methanoregulaceae archaeon]|nr:hypothetical protein [Methanoregulaceae archaeon]
MSLIAKLLARELWWAMLWLMRRPWMKRLQRASLRLLGEKRRARARDSMRRQNAFARKFGLPLLVFTINLLLASMIITLSYFALIHLSESGALSVPGASP